MLCQENILHCLIKVRYDANIEGWAGYKPTKQLPSTGIRRGLILEIWRS